ncbi:hypothetical protein [Arabidopsis thaliana]|uniref:Uncharacterized protein AT4g03660 n=1 Tax=Arabidopsis thaliana TaxID=3702 RepID=Q9SY44_ARATH|nr:hypothetical protein [Arabidopsis thaliana]CAB77851.1 hypothetical protein [Arabidopsis thaliana]
MSVHKLTNLRDKSTNWKINVKFLSICNHPPKSHGEITTMILHDEKTSSIRVLRIGNMSRMQGVWCQISRLLRNFHLFVANVKPTINRDMSRSTFWTICKF